MSPRFDDLEEIKIDNSPYTFSAAKLEDLSASEYTLVCICVDQSASVLDFKKDLEKCISNIVASCINSPRADNLLIRLSTFNYTINEIHGFKLLENCNPGDYDNCLRPSGCTALNDACINSIVSVAEYGKNLRAADFKANGIVFVLTDGCENVSTSTVTMVKNEIEQVRKKEKLESLMTLLIGVNINDPNVSSALQLLRTEAGFDKYIEIKDAAPKTLAKLAEFVSKSISSQSKAINTGKSGQIPTI